MAWETTCHKGNKNVISLGRFTRKVPNKNVISGPR